MKLLLYSFLVCLLNYVDFTWALKADKISDCPALPRGKRATSVHNLKASDIEVVAALGDSVTAGLLGVNINTSYVTSDQFKEYRGQSFLMGGDPSANSIANFIKHYNPDLEGSSIGERPARLCPVTFFCLDSYHKPEIDHFNAAQSGATSKELPEQVDYLVERIGNHTKYADKWKMINVFIGFNDVSVSCLPGRNATEFYTNVYGNLKRLLQNIDYAFVNLVGVMHYNDLIYSTLKVPGYRKNFENNSVNFLDYECYCCRSPQGGLSFLGDSVTKYNQMLEVAARRLSGSVIQDILGPLLGKIPRNVAVVYQPMNVLIPTVPFNALSNIDGFHPNNLGYKFLAKEVWSQIHLPKASKAQSSAFNASMPVFCPSEHDKFQTYQDLI